MRAETVRNKESAYICKAESAFVGKAGFMERIKNIIFDLDGTLYDSTGLPKKLIIKELLRGKLFWLGAERKARKELAGKAFASEEDFYDEFFRLIAAHAHSSADKLRAWYMGQYMPGFVDILSKCFKARESVNEFLTTLKDSGLKLIVFSDYASVVEKLGALGVDTKLFDGIFDAPSLGGLKPCRESFLKILSQMEISADETLMIGDRDDTDGAGAASVGMGFVRVFKSESKAAKYRKDNAFDGKLPDNPQDFPPLRWEEFCSWMTTKFLHLPTTRLFVG